jgi:hypothetical protein
MPRPNARIIRNQHDLALDAQIFTVRPVDELIRRGAHVARDGYPASSMGGNGGSTDISRPTENAATAPPLHDPTGNDIREIRGNLEEIYRLSLGTGVVCSRVMAAEEQKGQRVSTLDECKACQRTVAGTDNDRIKGAGYCAGRYAAFARYRDNLPTTAEVNHTYFGTQRRDYLAQEEPQHVTA